MKCQDCKGSGRYVSCFTDEPCQRCHGTGKEGGKSKLEQAKDIARKAVKSVFDAQPHKKLAEVPIGEPEECVIGSSGLGGLLPEIKVGSIIHVFDADWYEAEVQKIYKVHRHGQEWTMIRADAVCDTFRMMYTDLRFDVKRNRWECIRAGTPVYP